MSKVTTTFGKKKVEVDPQENQLVITVGNHTYYIPKNNPSKVRVVKKESAGRPVQQNTVRVYLSRKNSIIEVKGGTKETIMENLKRQTSRVFRDYSNVLVETINPKGEKIGTKVFCLKLPNDPVNLINPASMDMLLAYLSTPGMYTMLKPNSKPIAKKITRRPIE